MYRVGFVLFTIIITSCSPLVTLYQESPDSKNSLGVIETSEVTIYLQHIGNRYGHMIFDFEVMNHSDSAISISPHHISYYASSKMFSEPCPLKDLHRESFSNSQLMYKRVFARSPAQVRKILYDHERELAALKTVLLVASVAALAYDATKDNRDYQKENYTRQDATRSIQRDILVTSTIAAHDIAASTHQTTKEDIYYSDLELFPEIKIEKGCNQRGKIFLPLESPFRYTRIIIPIGQTDYVLDFKQPLAKGKLITD